MATTLWILVLAELCLLMGGVAGAQQLSGQTGNTLGAPPPPPRPALTQQAPAAPGRTTDNPFQGSIPSADQPGPTIQLTLDDAIARALRQNLGLALGDQNTRLAAADRLRAYSNLLPNLSARANDSVEQINLRALGFNVSVPGFNFPSVVGPFNVFDVRAYLTQQVLNFPSINNVRAARESEKAARLTFNDNRELVILVTATAYLQVIFDAARIEEAQSEVSTAQTLYERAADLLKNGLSPAIDSLRSQVELQTEQTRLRSYQNDFAKDKLVLSRVIGLPAGQQFTLDTTIPYTPLEGITVETAVSEALQMRQDYKALEAQVRAAELSKRAAQDQRLPSINFNADYGDIGPNPLNSHGTFTVTGSVGVSLFEGGRIRADVEQADAQMRQRKAQLADIRGQIDFQVRSAILDLQTAADQVATARSSLDLARQTLDQARDRFTAGVTDNIEVVQAQNSVAGASEAYISSVFAHNLAKANLARSMGVAGQRVTQYLEGK